MQNVLYNVHFHSVPTSKCLIPSEKKPNNNNSPNIVIENERTTVFYLILVIVWLVWPTKSNGPNILKSFSSILSTFTVSKICFRIIPIHCASSLHFRPIPSLFPFILIQKSTDKQRHIHINKTFIPQNFSLILYVWLCISVCPLSLSICV